MHRHRWFTVLAFHCLIAVFSIPPVGAQTSRADSAAILLEATRRLEIEGESLAAQELLDLIVRHFPGTPAAAEAELALTESLTQGHERSGRASLIAFNTLYGAFLGLMVPAAFDEYPSEEAFGAGLLIGAPLGFFATKALVDHYPMRGVQGRQRSRDSALVGAPGKASPGGKCSISETGQQQSVTQTGDASIGRRNPTRLRSPPPLWGGWRA